MVGKYPDGTPAIVEGTFGNGWVILSGVHPEAPAELAARNDVRDAGERGPRVRLDADPRRTEPDIAADLLRRAVRLVPPVTGSQGKVRAELRRRC